MYITYFSNSILTLAPGSRHNKIEYKIMIRYKTK